MTPFRKIHFFVVTVLDIMFETCIYKGEEFPLCYGFGPMLYVKTIKLSVKTILLRV